jgi:periplasmic protein TonB
MFNNLIESSSHRTEIKRRGSFLLFTTATYAMLFAIAGVASIYAYDARLNQQSTELTILTFRPPEPEIVRPAEPQPGPLHGGSENPNITQPTRPILIDSVNNPTNPPEDIGITAPTIPPAPHNAVIGPEVADPPGSGRSGSEGTGDSSASRVTEAVNAAGTPPPAPASAPPKIVKVSTVLNSRALQLPKPQYPPIARSAGIQGMVSIQVLIDEEGKVVSAKVVSGSPLLVHEAQRAAYLARFSPTTINDIPVKVSGVITYNFVLQR